MKKIFSFLLLGLLLSIGNVWAAFEKASSIAVGDQVVFVYETGTMELKSISSTSTPYGIGIKYTTTPAGTWTFDVVAGSATNTFAFKNGDNYLAWSSGNSLKVSSTLDSNSSWTVTFESGNAIISNAQTSSRKLQWNAGSPRFACYTSNQTAIQLYKMVNASVAAPVFSPAEGSFFETQNVSITCPTNGAAIYYTLDGSDPTSESTPYSNPIEVSETKTIKAIAIVGNESSSIASATYTIVTQKTIAEVRAQETGSVFTQGIVTSSSSDGKTVYIQDASAGVVIYSTSDLSLTVGDEITVKGTLSSYHNLLEITSPVVNVLSQGNSVSPAVKTIAEINADNTYSLQGLLIKIENAKVSEINEQNVTLAQSANTIVVRFANASDVTTAGIEVDDVISLVGNIGCYNGAQIANPTDVQIAVNEEPSISVIATEINATAAETVGTIAISYENITISEANDFAILFYNAEEEELESEDEPNWVLVSVEAAAAPAEGYVVSYAIGSNEGAARTAYFKVYALDGEDLVYSNLVTISQAEYVAPEHGTTPEDPYSVAEVLVANDATDVYVEGYIVGFVTGTSSFTTTIASGNNSNWALADDAGEDSFDNIIPIQISGASTQASYGLSNNPHLMGAKVLIKGNITNYFSKRGIKNVAEISILSVSLVLGTNGYSTFAADFAYTVSDDATAYKAHYDAQQGAVVLTEVEGVIPANTGIILKGEEGAHVTITPSDKEVTADFEDNDLVGVLTPTAVTKDDNVYVITTNEDGTKFNPCGSVTIPAHKAYMVIEQLPANAPVRIIFAENNATAIQNLEGDETAVKFIENGKLYIRKNGVVYDATGAVVR